MSYWKPKVGTNFWAYQKETRTLHYLHALGFAPFTAEKYIYGNQMLAKDSENGPMEFDLSDWRFLPAPKNLPKSV